jgi:hypothetical protein
LLQATLNWTSRRLDKAPVARVRIVGSVNQFSAPGCIGKLDEKVRLLRIPFRQFNRSGED